MFDRILLPAVFTLIGGIALLLFSKILVDPINELKRTIGEIAACVFKHHNLLRSCSKINYTF